MSPPSCESRIIDVEGKNIGAVDDTNHYASGRFVVRVHARRRLGEALSVVTKLLRQHKLENDAVVSRLDREAE